MVPKTNAVHYGGQRQTAEKLSRRLSEDAWITVTGGTDAQSQA
jgi:hypothetical protein